MNRPICFIVMPFGKKPDADGLIIDFDAVYQDLLEPAVSEAKMDPIRADEERTGGIIHKPMFERLILCDFAVADLTTANANVFYELGVRHGIRPWSTILVFAEGSRLPFDVAPLRGLPYRLSPTGLPVDLENFRVSLVKKLEEARKTKPDSPVFEFVKDLKPPEISHLKTDTFRESIEYSSQVKEKLAQARTAGIQAVRNVEKELGQISNVEAGVIVDLFLSYRSLEAYEDVINLVNSMPLPLVATAMVQEQLAFALNRKGESERAERILKQVIASKGPNSETYGILGRVYKDRWQKAAKAGQSALARGYIDEAIDAYRSGFEADWRDSYPGVNLVTLMEVRDPPLEERLEILPVVLYSVNRRLASGKGEYWDYATLLELSVLKKDENKAQDWLCKALASTRDAWERKTTVNNLKMIREARERRKEALPWALEIEQSLEKTF